MLRYHIMRGWLLLLTLLATVTVSAQDNIDQLYAELDRALEAKPQLIKEKQLRIATIKQSLKKAVTPEERYQLNEDLYEEYASFQYDSATSYVKANLQLSKGLGEKGLYRYNRTLLNQVHILSVGGFLEQASAVLAQVDTVAFNDYDKVKYYRISDDLNLYKSEFTQGTEYSLDYIAQASKARDNILKLSIRESFDYIVTKTMVLNLLNQRQEALNILCEELNKYKSGDREFSILSSIIAYYYSLEHKLEKQKIYLIKSAISDAKGCIREETSLREIAKLLFQEGDIDRAYHYFSESLDNANAYNTRLRSIQLASTTPTIISAYDQKQQAINTRLTLMVSNLLLVGIVLAVGTIYLIRTRRKVTMANGIIKSMNRDLKNTMDQLEKTNQTLSEVNGALLEANKIREEYIGRFMDLSSQLIDRSNRHDLELRALVMNRKYEELYKILKSTKFNDSLTEIFYKNFDDAFLNIHPNFVIEVNDLLQEGHKIELKVGEHMTTELRLLALIRLGINKNQTIADILRSSITTIYTYRSKLKMRAINKDTFENDIMSLT